MKCLECGYELTSESKNSEIIIKCPQCGWTAVTTSMSEIADDITKYSIIIEGGNEVKKDVLKLISKKSGKNILETRKLLMDGGLMIEEYAENVKVLAEELELLGISYHIKPEFPY